MKHIPPYHGGNGDPTSNHNGSSISGDSEISSAYTCFSCETDGHITKFCSQMQLLVDHGPNNNILYPNGPQLLVNRESHEQSMQALTPGHHVDKRDNPYTHLLAKPNKMGNRFRTHPEVTSDEDISSEKFTHKTPVRLRMTAGRAKHDQFKWSWSISRADEPYTCDQLSDQLLPLETQFSGVAYMANREFQEKYVQFNVALNSGETDQWIISELLVHEIASHHIMATP